MATPTVPGSRYDLGDGAAVQESAERASAVLAHLRETVFVIQRRMCNQRGACGWRRPCRLNLGRPVGNSYLPAAPPHGYEMISRCRRQRMRAPTCFLASAILPVGCVDWVPSAARGCGDLQCGCWLR